MIKTPIYRVFLLSFIAILLSTQWTSAHIHLAEAHHHHGSSHTHSEGHAHIPLSYHENTIDVSNHTLPGASFIELDPSYYSPSTFHITDSVGLLNTSIFPWPIFLRKNDATPLQQIKLSYRFLAQSHLQLRAPPLQV